MQRAPAADVELLGREAGARFLDERSLGSYLV